MTSQGFSRKKHSSTQKLLYFRRQQNWRLPLSGARDQGKLSETKICAVQDAKDVATSRAASASQDAQPQASMSTSSRRTTLDSEDRKEHIAAAATATVSTKGEAQ